MTHVKKLSVILEITLVNITRKGFDASSTFRQTNSNEIIKIIKTLNINKACQYTDFPTKIIIKFNDNLEISIIVLKNVNLRREYADVIPVHKEKEKTEANHRPVSILPNLSKIYEKSMYQ